MIVIGGVIAIVVCDSDRGCDCVIVIGGVIAIGVCDSDRRCGSYRGV